MKKIIFVLLTLCVASWEMTVQAFPNVSITSVTPGSLEGPIHHGLIVDTQGITDPNLTSYEVQIKPDTGGPLPPWLIYSTMIQPYDGKLINIPYRNGIAAITTTQPYCVRVRGIYGETVTAWDQRCGLHFEPLTGPEVDTDGDTLPDIREYVMGLDPRDTDSDRDGIGDGIELASGRDPLRPYIPNLAMRTPTLMDFGLGNPAASYRSQHQYIEIENTGDEVAMIESITVAADDGSSVADVFHVGAFDHNLSHIPPQNRVLIPISFVPHRRGLVSARLNVVMQGSGLFQTVSLRGQGVQIPDCQVTPVSLDFGNPSVIDQEVLVHDVVLANRPAAGDTQPPNDDNTPWNFVLSTTHPELAPGLRGFQLARGEDLRLPVIFPHMNAGNYNGQLEIRSFACGTQRVSISAQAH